MRRYEPCPHCGSTVRPGASTCPVCGPHAHGRPTMPMSRDEFASMLGEGFHTAFRKAAGSPASTRIWREIGDMDPDEWASILGFVTSGFEVSYGLTWMPKRCPARLSFEDPYERYSCTLPADHPGNHESWLNGDLMAEWDDRSAGAGRRD